MSRTTPVSSVSPDLASYPLTNQNAPERLTQSRTLRPFASRLGCRSGYCDSPSNDQGASRSPAALTRRQLLDLAGDTPFDTLTTPPDEQPGPHSAGAGHQRHCYIDGGVRSPDNADLAGTHEPPLLAVIYSTVVVVWAPIVNRSDRRSPGPRWRLAELEIGLLLVSNQHVALPVEYARVPPPVVTAGRTRARGDPGDRR
jgi:hypothetical protein